MPLGIDIFQFFNDFGAKNNIMLDRKCMQALILSSKGCKAEKYYKNQITLFKNEVSGIGKSNKNSLRFA